MKIFTLYKVYLNKFYKKAFRVFMAYFQYIEVPRVAQLKLLDFKIFQLDIKSPDICFNFSAAYLQDERQYVGVARQFIASKEIFHDSKIYIGRFNSFGEPIQLRDLNDSVLRQKIIGYVRLEDLRIFTFDKNIFAFCVCISKSHDDVNKTNMHAKQLLISIRNAEILSFKILDTGLPVEKNWTLLNLDYHSAFLVYSLIPFQVINIQLIPNNDVEFLSVRPINSFNQRNSTNFIQLDKFKLGVGHCTIDLGFRYAYLHFFIKIFDDGLVETTKPFVFNEFSNEFAMSLLRYSEDRLVILYSNHESGNLAASFNTSNIDKMEWIKSTQK